MGNWFYCTSCKDTFYDDKKKAETCKEHKTIRNEIQGSKIHEGNLTHLRSFLKKERKKKTLLLKANNNQTCMIENDQITPPVIKLWISRSKNNDWKYIKAYKNDNFLFQVPYWVFIFL